MIAAAWRRSSGCRVRWQGAAPVPHVSDLHSSIDINPLHSTSALEDVTGGSGGSDAIHMLMMSSSCSTRSKSNHLLPTAAECPRRAALRNLNSGKN